MYCYKQNKITEKGHLKSTKTLGFKATKVEESFTSEKLTSYSVLTVINDYANHLGLHQQLDRVFSTVINNAIKIHALYGERAECENRIENTKNQLCAGQTITNDFHVNDILWQLSVMAYNISVLIRYDSDYKTWKQEPKTFREWFILVPGKVVTNARRTTVKMSVHYLYAKQWERLTGIIPMAA